MTTAPPHRRRVHSRGRTRLRNVSLTVLTVTALVGATLSPAGAVDPPWHIVTAPNQGAIDNHLQEVSCVSATRCVAVGYNQDPSAASGFHRQSVVQTRNGATWSLGTIPQRGTGSNTLWNVSCVAGPRCIAVGYYANLAVSHWQTLIATYAQGKWTLNASPNRAGTDNFLFGIDCADALHCVAVGRSYVPSTGRYRSLILTKDNGPWTIAASPNRGGVTNLLADVSCGDATHCAAVGYTVTSVPVPGGQPDIVVRTLILSRDGATWSLTPAPNVASADNQLRDVSCPTATTCVAVGGTDPGTAKEKTLITTLSGGTWSLTPSADRPAYDNHLWAVSCDSETSCVAGGQSQNSTLSRTLVETLSGGTWTVTTSPSRPRTFNFLYGLSCPGAGTCVAAGDYINPVSNVSRNAIITNIP